MKKVLLFLMMLVAMLPAFLQAQETVEIGTGTSTTYYVPFNALYGYSFTEQLYYAEQINTAGTITSISFYHKPSSTVTAQTDDIVIFMKNVSRSSFSSSSDFETVTQSDIVYSGTWTIPATEGWTTITLDNPFYYDGSSNLMVAMHEYTSGYSTRYFTYTSTTETRCVQLYSDSYNPDPYNPGTYSGSRTTRTYLSNIQLEITSAAITCPAPNNLTVVNVTESTGIVSWGSHGTEMNWDVYLTTTQTDVPDSNTTPTDVAMDTFYTATNLNSQSTYYFYVRANCGAGDLSRWRSTTFTTTQVLATLPYNQDFEDATENASWALVNGSQTNQWYIGSAVNHTDNGTNALYITNDAGVTNAYSHTASYVWAYRDIDFGQYAAYQIDFDWRNVGESANYDYLKVWIGDPAVVTAGNSTLPGSANATLIGNYHNQDTWQHASIALSSEYSGSKRLYFYWYNDGGGGNNPPAAVDNLSILGLNCGFPTSLAIDTITTNSVTIHWHPATDNDNMWDVAVAPYGTASDSADYTTMYDTLQVIGNLTPNTHYVVYVRTNCGTEVSSCVTTSFFTDCDVIDAIPFVEHFDEAGTATSSTAANPGPLPNCWTRLTNYTTPYPYISSSQHASGVGAVYFYSTSAYYSMLVSPVLDLSNYSANSLNLSFKLYKTSAGYGRMQVGVMTDPSDASTFVALKNIYSTDIANVSTWTDFNVVLPAQYNTPIYLAFKSPAEATSYAWLDDVVLDYVPSCSEPRHLEVSQIQGSSALVSWEEALFGTPDYMVEYSEYGMDTWSTPVAATGTSYMLSGLQPNTQYEVRVYSDCGGQVSAPITESFLTSCLSGGEVVFDQGTATNYYVPVNDYYHFCYTQQIYLASEMNGATDIKSLSFDYAYSSPMTKKTDVNVYLGHTTQSDFATTSSWVPFTDLHLVYSGALNCTVQGWNTFMLDSIFHYNGSDNLVLVVDDNSDQYDGSAYVFHYQSQSPDYRSMYYQSDSSNPDPTNPPTGTRTYNRSNVKFGGDCDSVWVCVRPNVYVSSINGTDVTIDWAPGNTENSWAVEYKISTDQNWTSEGTVNTNTYTFSNLSSGTNYQFRVRAVCSPADSSEWVMTTAFVPCSSISNLPYTQGFESATGSGSSHTVDICLTRGTNSSTAYPYPSSTYHYSGTYSLYFYGASSTYSYVALPRMDESIAMNNLMIQFYAYKTSAAYSIEVGVMSDPTNISTFEVLGTFTPSAVNTWDMGEFLTNTYTGTGRYIAFRAPQSATSYMYLDDIMVDYIPTCPHVTNIHTSSVGENTATIKWTAGGTETQWAYLYGPAGTVDPTVDNPSYASEDSVDLSGLTANTLYTIYVQAYCDASDQSTWMHYNFRTECPSLTLPPFTENFDTYGTATSTSTSTPGPLPSCWTRLTNYSSPYPYISSSQHASGSGAVYFYSTSAYYSMLVSPQLDLSNYAANSLNLSFKLYKTSASYGRMQAGIMTDPTNASTFVVLKDILPADLATTSTWTDFNVVLPNQYTTPVYIAFRAPAEATSYAYLDDVVLDEVPDCAPPRHITFSQIQGSSALVTWDEPLFGTPDYQLQYSELGMDNWSSPVTLTNTTYMLSGLDPNTHYEVRIYSDCGGVMSQPASETFMTVCLSGGEVVFDHGTTTTYQVPVNNLWKYSYTQQIFLSSEMNGPTDINSVSFEYAYTSPMTQKTNVNIYLGHTTQSDFSGTSDYVPLSNLSLVYSGNLNCTQQGWNLFVFDSIFHYNGTDNLVLVVDDNSNAYNSSTYTFKCETLTDYRTLYYYSDTYNPDPSNPTASGASGSRIYNRNNVKFGGNCDSLVTCIAPNLYVDNVTTTTADVIWVSGYNENAWEMEYKKAVDTIWTPVLNPTGNLVQLSNLEPSTRYNVRMRSDCGGGEYSNDVTANFTTECGAISTLPFIDNFDTYGTGTNVYPMCWGKINTYSSDRPYINTGGFSAPGLMYFYAGSSGTYNMAITPEFDQTININTLQVSFKYKAYSASDRLVVGVMTNPDSAATFVPVDTIVPDPTTYSTWSDQVVYMNRYQGNGQYIAFMNAYTTTSSYAYMDNLEIDVMPTCLRPGNLNVTCDNTSATLSWVENGNATAWDIEYGTRGFTQGTGTTVSGVTTNPYTVTGLTAGTPYDFYVRANCGNGDESTWLGPAGAVPGAYILPSTGQYTLSMCGGTIYDDGGINGDYSTNSDVTLVINPDTAGMFVHLTGTFAVEEGWDILTIYDGAGTSGTVLFDSETDYTLDVVSTTGPLTLHFESDGSVTDDGFEIMVSCEGGITPPEPCDAPTGLTVTAMNGTSVTLDWNQTGTPDDWTISYKQASAAAWSTVTTATKPYTITDLATDVEYQAFVVANCGDQESDESNHISFTIVGVNDYVNNTMVYPNPTTGIFRIENSESRIESVEVYDVYGKLISTVKVDDNSVELDLTGNASGIYFTRIMTDKGVVTKRIVKK